MRTDQIADMRIGIIGGGFAGLTAGIALQRIGAHVTIYEQAEGNFEVGAGIGLRPASIKLFHQLGISDAIEAVSSPSDNFEILDAQGTLIAAEPWPYLDDDGHRYGTRLIHRRDFIDALTAQLPPDVIRYSTRATRVIDKGGVTTVEFSDGTTADFDLIVGADGIRSTIRTAISPNTPIFHHAHVYRAVVEADNAHGLLTDDNVRLYFDPDTGALIYFIPLRHRGAAGQFSLDLTCPNDDPTWNPTVSHEHVQRVYRNFDERLQAIIADLHWDSVNQRAAHDLDLIDRWNTDSIALIGDAAHAMLHHQLQGANSAIVDAGVLAEALVASKSIPAALEQYTTLRRDSVHALQRLSRRPIAG